MDGQMYRKEGPGSGGVYYFTRWCFKEQFWLFADFSVESWRKKRLNAYGGSWGQWLFGVLSKWKLLFSKVKSCLKTVCALVWLQLFFFNILHFFLVCLAFSHWCPVCTRLEQDIFWRQVLICSFQSEKTQNCSVYKV